MKNKKGFTLVELLAVIVILGVLLLVAVPAVTRVIATSRFNADKKEAIEFLRQVQNCSMSEKGNSSLCTASETSAYLENKGNGVKWEASYSTTTSSIDSNGLIILGNFYFKGSNGFVFYNGWGDADHGAINNMIGKIEKGTPVYFQKSSLAVYDKNKEDKTDVNGIPHWKKGGVSSDAFYTTLTKLSGVSGYSYIGSNGS